MKKKDKINEKNKKGLVIFVEGETEVEFYNCLINYLRCKNTDKKMIDKLFIKNLKGVCNYSFKATTKFKNEIKQKNRDTDFFVICTYDNDVFKYAAKPPVNWKLIEKELIEYGANEVVHIIAKDMIEDWFLIDLNGLCNYLNISDIPNLKGKNGLEKISKLFRKKNKIYIKGSYCYKFMDKLDMDKIYKTLEADFQKLEKLLFR